MIHYGIKLHKTINGIKNIHLPKKKFHIFLIEFFFQKLIKNALK